MGEKKAARYHVELKFLQIEESMLVICSPEKAPFWLIMRQAPLDNRSWRCVKVCSTLNEAQEIAERWSSEEARAAMA